METKSTRKNESETGRFFRLLDGTTLKLIAMVSMVFDHVGDNFFPGQTWMRIIGRMALPIFAFCVAEGFYYTRDRGKYLTRMGLFACVREIKALELSHQNIMLTFFWAILGLICFEKLRARKTKAATAAGAVVLLFFAVSSIFLGMDYSVLATGLIFIYYLLHSKAPVWNNLAAAGYHALLRNVGIYWFGLLGFLPVLLYNGQKGKGLKWLFYAFYPGHLLLIWALLRFMR